MQEWAIGVFRFASRHTAEGNEPLQMVVCIAQLMVDHDHALGEMRHGQLPCHANAAMHLDRFFRDQLTDPANQVLAACQRLLAGQAILLEGRGCIDDGRTGLFDLDQHFCHAVLQGLKRADDTAKLLAGAQVLQCGFFADLHGSKGFSTKRQNALANRLLD